MSEKGNVISRGSTKWVTIKLDTDMLVEQFQDMFPDTKIKNKLGFACKFSTELMRHILNEGIDRAMNTTLDSDDNKGWLKFLDEEE